MQEKGELVISLMVAREEAVTLREGKSENEQFVQQLQAKLEGMEIAHKEVEKNVRNIRKLIDE